MDQARISAYNQIGAMEYCQSKGYADATDVAAQRATLTMMPAAPATPEMIAAETTGRTGTIAFPNGVTTTFADMATKSNVSESALCGHMVDTVKQMNAMRAANPMPTMPSGMPTMPAMPNGMPAMPAMPGMPSAAPAR